MPSLIRHAIFASTDSNGFTSSSIDTTGGDLIVIQVSSGSFTFSDSAGNTWTTAVSETTFSPESSYILYAWNANVSATHTFTIAGTSISPSFEVLVFSGSQITGDPLDQVNHAHALGGTTIQPGSITPSADNGIIVSGVGHQDTSNTISVDSSLTITDQITQTNGQHVGSAAAYLFQGSAASIDPTWSEAAGNLYAASIASFLTRSGDESAFIGEPQTGSSPIQGGLR
jgi:hypothetical protein